ncbi:hypothetical protein PO909_029988 [Leuciscus waleckii]
MTKGESLGRGNLVESLGRASLEEPMVGRARTEPTGQDGTRETETRGGAAGSSGSGAVDGCAACGSTFQQGISRIGSGLQASSSGGAEGLAELCEGCDIRLERMVVSRVQSTEIKEKNKSASISFIMLSLNIDGGDDTGRVWVGGDDTGWAWVGVDSS